MNSKRYKRIETRCVDLALIGLTEKITAYTNHEQPLIYICIKVKSGVPDMNIQKNSWCNIAVRTPDEWKLEDFISALRGGKIIVSILKNSLKDSMSNHGKMYAMKAIDAFLNPRASEEDDDDDEDDDEEKESPKEPPKKNKK